MSPQRCPLLIPAAVSVSLPRRGVPHHFCGQKEAEQEVGRQRGGRQQLGGDAGDAAPAGSLLLHRQGQHPEAPAPHPDRLHRHQGTHTVPLAHHWGTWEP